MTGPCVPSGTHSWGAALILLTGLCPQHGSPGLSLGQPIQHLHVVVSLVFSNGDWDQEDGGTGSHTSTA